MNYALNSFDDIRPYEADEIRQAFRELLADRQFTRVLKGLMPWLPASVSKAMLRLSFVGVRTPLGFQKRFMKPFVRYIIRRHTDGCTFDDTAINPHPLPERSSPPRSLPSLIAHPSSPIPRPRYTFLSNHRDIVLDSALLDLHLVERHYPTTVEIGIGDNLLIYPWIKTLVRMNKAFIVRRGLSPRETLLASRHMSQYIHYAVTEKHENIWLAQREGRAKDSSDHTQESVLKMLAMGGDLKNLNIVPLTISYEYDPCDYLKAKEFQLRRDNPAYKKSRQDDLDNMRTGIFGDKGRVHYHCGTPVNQWLDELSALPRTEYFNALSQRIDREIHSAYQLFPNNYIADDLLRGTDTHAGKHYTDDDRRRFEDYLTAQMAKIQIADKDEAFLRERMLTMYANPLRNKLKATTT